VVAGRRAAASEWFSTFFFQIFLWNPIPLLLLVLDLDSQTTINKHKGLDLGFKLSKQKETKEQHKAAARGYLG